MTVAGGNTANQLRRRIRHDSSCRDAVADVDLRLQSQARLADLLHPIALRYLARPVRPEDDVFVDVAAATVEARPARAMRTQRPSAADRSPRPQDSR